MERLLWCTQQIRLEGWGGVQKSLNMLKPRQLCKGESIDREVYDHVGGVQQNLSEVPQSPSGIG